MLVGGLRHKWRETGGFKSDLPQVLRLTKACEKGKNCWLNAPRLQVSRMIIVSVALQIGKVRVRYP